MSTRPRGPGKQWEPVELTSEERSSLDTFCVHELPRLLEVRRTLLEQLGNDPDEVYRALNRKAEATRAKDQEAYEAAAGRDKETNIDVGSDALSDVLDVEDLADADFEKFLPWFQLNHLEHQLLAMLPTVRAWTKLYTGLQAEFLFDEVVEIFRRFSKANCSWEDFDHSFEEWQNVARVAGIDLSEIGRHLANPDVGNRLGGPKTRSSNRQGPAAAAEVMLGLLFEVPEASIDRLRKRALKVFTFFDVDRSPDAN